jgi:hypothetical protein
MSKRRRPGVNDFRPYDPIHAAVGYLMGSKNSTDLRHIIRAMSHNITQISHIVSAHQLKTAYIGWLGYDNLGDEIILDAHKKLFPSLDFIPYEKRDFAHAYHSLRRRSFYKAGFLGGGTLIDGTEYWLRRVEDLLNQNIPVACFGTGVSFDEFKCINNKPSLYLNRLKAALDQFQFIGVRGARSADALASIGVTRTQVVGDTALALAPQKISPHADTNRVGICFGLSSSSPIDGDEQEYMKEMIKFVRLLLYKGYEIVLLPIWREDIASNINLMSAVNHPGCTIKTNAYLSYKEYANEVKQCLYFFGQKLHSTIIATMLRIPVVMVGYRPKCQEYMESIKLPQYLLPVRKFTLNTAYESFEDVRANTEAIITSLDVHITQYKELQEKLAKQTLDLFM